MIAKNSDSQLEIKTINRSRRLKKGDRLCRICVLQERY
jgi:hypothetical protein